MPIGFSGIKDIEGFPSDFFTKENLDKRLETLKQSPIPPPKPRAMCYSISPARPEDMLTFSFICPICGTKTIHRVYRWDQLLRLDKIRDLAQSVRDMGFEIYLEEKCFCSRCKVEVPEGPAWRITIDSQTFYVKFYSAELDCDLLKKFLSARDKSDYDQLMQEIEGNTSRLEKLLGLKHE